MGCGILKKIEKEARRIRDDIIDEVERIDDNLEDFYNDAIEPFLNDIIDFFDDLYEFNMDVIDSVFEFFGVSGATNFLRDLNSGLSNIAKGVLAGDWDAIKAAGMLAIAIIITVVTWNPYLLVNTAGSVMALSQSVQTALLAAGYASSIYTVYSIALPVSIIGKYINNPMKLIEYAEGYANSLRESFVTYIVNGSYFLWLPGQPLYDSQKAGDIRFNVTGSLATTKFLWMEDKNSNEWISWRDGGKGDFSEDFFGNLAGDRFFSISKI